MPERAAGGAAATGGSPPGGTDAPLVRGAGRIISLKVTPSSKPAAANVTAGCGSPIFFPLCCVISPRILLMAPEWPLKYIRGSSSSQRSGRLSFARPTAGV